MHFTDEAPKHVHTHSGPHLLCIVFRNDLYISHFRIYPLLWSFFSTYWAVVAAIIIVQAKDLVRAFYSQVLRLSCSLTESKATAEDNLFTISEDCGRVTLTALFLAYFFLCVCILTAVYVTDPDESQIVIPESGCNCRLLGNRYPLYQGYQFLTHRFERNG